MQITKAVVDGGSWEFSLLPNGKVEGDTYQSTADGMKWLQFAFRDVGVDKPIPTNAMITVQLTGIIRIDGDEVPFQEQFSFRSEVLKKTVNFNPWIDR